MRLSLEVSHLSLIILQARLCLSMAPNDLYVEASVSRKYTCIVLHSHIILESGYKFEPIEPCSIMCIAGHYQDFTESMIHVK